MDEDVVVAKYEEGILNYVGEYVDQPDSDC